MQHQGNRFEDYLEDQEWFPEETVPAVEGGLGAGGKVAVARDEHYGRGAIELRFVDFGAELVTIHAGHFHVQEDHIVGLPPGQGQRCLAIRREVGRVEQFRERQGHGAAADRVVIHGQEPDGRLGHQVGLHALAAQVFQQVQGARHGPHHGRAEVGGLGREPLEQSLQRKDHLPNRQHFRQPGALAQRARPLERLKQLGLPGGLVRRAADFG